MLDIAGKTFKVIDISRLVVPGENPDRPFDMTRGLLGDGTTKFDITRTHTHVGSHIEGSSHFFDDGRSIEKYPLQAFFGRGVLLDVGWIPKQDYLHKEDIQDAIGDILRAGDVVVCRNSQPGDPPQPKHLAEDAAIYLRDQQVKMVVLGDHVGFGGTVEEGRMVHELLMRQTTFLEIVSHLEDITQREFIVMALPILVKGVDSSWCRPVILEEIR